MNTNLFKSAIAALALMVTFNSCKKDDDKPSFPTEDIKLLIDDGRVFAKQDSLRDEYFYSGEKEGYSDRIAVGTSPDNIGSVSLSDVEPFTKYYWCVRVRDRKNSNPDEYIESEIRSFYYVIAPQITKVYNPEGDWATILKWEHNDCLKEATVTLTPDKDCQYDKTPIVVDAAQDSCYISAGGEFDSKYAVYHQWWDDSKAQYYEPVIYSFKVTYSGEIDGHSFTVESEPKKYIFLDRAKYAADRQFNVYRMGRIGNRTWLLEDLRGIPTDDEGFPTEQNRRIHDSYKVLDSIPDWVERTIDFWHPLLISPLGFKARCYYEFENSNYSIIPEGFHLATDDDWQDLEYTYGLDRMDYNNFQKLGIQSNGLLNGDLLNYTPDWAGTNDAFGRNLYDKYANDTLIYVGGKFDIFSKLISDNEWTSNDSINAILPGNGGFNARPYGLVGSRGAYRTGYSAAFMTSTKDSMDEDRRIIRLLWSANHGIGRINLNSYWDNHYLYRCVKDN